MTNLQTLVVRTEVQESWAKIDRKVIGHVQFILNELRERYDEAHYYYPDREVCLERIEAIEVAIFEALDKLI